MESRVYPLDLPDVKAYLSLNPDDTSQDAFLTDCIGAVCDQLVQWLPFSIIEEDVSRTDPLMWQIPGTPVRIVLAGPVLSIASVTCILQDGTEAVLDPTAWRLNGTTLTITNPPAGAIEVRINYRVGSNVPPAIRSALLMMCKNRYERRDEDPMTDAVWGAIRPFLRPNI